MIHLVLLQVVCSYVKDPNPVWCVLYLMHIVTVNVKRISGITTQFFLGK